MGDPAPLQPELPFDLEAPAPVARSPKPADEASTPVPGDRPSPPAWRPTVVEAPAAPLTQILDRVRAFPWARWRALAGRALGGSLGIGAVGARALRGGAAVAGTLIVRGAPYAATLARNLARA